MEGNTEPFSKKYPLISTRMNRPVHNRMKAYLVKMRALDLKERKLIEMAVDFFMDAVPTVGDLVQHMAQRVEEEQESEDA